MKNKTKIAVVGAGFVGSTIAYTLMLSSLSLEVVLIDINNKKARGDALDIMHGAPFLPASTIQAGTYADCKDCDLIIITAGANQKPEGETRLELLKANSGIFRQIIADIMHNCLHQPIILVVSNPVDVLTYMAFSLSGYDKNRIIGSGTVLDSSRLKFLIGGYAGVDPKSVHAYLIGEHGDSEVTTWSRTSIAGMHFDEFCAMNGDNAVEVQKSMVDSVRQAAYEVVGLKGATYYAIALSVRRIVECILNDERSILTVSSVLTGEHGLSGVALSLPSIVGRNGIEKILPIKFTDEELQGLRNSASVLKEHLGTIGL